MRPHIKYLCDYLVENGAQDVRVERGGKHYKLRWTWHGKPMTFICAITPSDWRGDLNNISDLRRLLGLTKTKKTVGERRERRMTKSETEASATGTATDFHEWRAREARASSVPVGGLPLVVECWRRGRLIKSHRTTDEIAPRAILKQLNIDKTWTVRTYREGSPHKMHIIQRENSTPQTVAAGPLAPLAPTPEKQVTPAPQQATPMTDQAQAAPQEPPQEFFELWLLTPEEVCERLSIGRTKFYKLIKRGLLKTVKMGGYRRITLNALKDFISSLEGER